MVIALPQPTRVDNRPPGRNPERAVRRVSGRVTLAITADGALWNELVATQRGRTAFHTWQWIDFTENAIGVPIKRFVAMADGRPVGICPLPLPNRPSPRTPEVPYPYLGPLVPAELLHSTVAAIRREQWRCGVESVYFDLSPADSTPDTLARLRAAKIHVIEDRTVTLDLSHGSPETFRAAMSTNRRRNANRAARSGALVRPARPGELISILPRVLTEAYEAHGRTSPYPLDTGARFEQWAVGQSKAATWVVTVDDELAGALIMLGDDKSAMMWTVGCLRRFREIGPNTLLYRDAIEASMANGYKDIDLCGWVDDAIGRFKMGFGSEQRPYFQVRSSLLPAELRQVAIQAKRRLRG